MSQIVISKEFFELMKKLSSIQKIMSGVIFKGKDANGQYTGKYYFNVPTKKSLIHVVATENDIKFEGDQIQISSVTEFLKFAELTGFPKCSIENVEETSIRGHKYHNIVFKGLSKEARLPVADISCFVDKNHFKICSTRESDPMRYVAKIGFTVDGINNVVKDIKQVSGCEYLSLDIENDECRFLLRGKGNQQITCKLDEHSFYVNNDSWLADAYADKKKLRLFSTVMFRLLGGIGTDSEVEIRHLKTIKNDIITLKGYCVKQGAKLDEANEDKDAPRSEIQIGILCVESSSANVTNVDFIK